MAMPFGVDSRDENYLKLKWLFIIILESGFMQNTESSREVGEGRASETKQKINAKKTTKFSIILLVQDLPEINKTRVE